MIKWKQCTTTAFKWTKKKEIGNEEEEEGETIQCSINIKQEQKSTELYQQKI